MNKYKLLTGSAIVLVCSLLTTISAHAHLMVAQHGTLNFLDDSVYMVLSLPASAFLEADENSDEKLSLTEFSENRTSLINIISNHVALSNKNGKLPLSSLMISPVTPHDSPKEPAEHVIVMGRFSLDGKDSELLFAVDLFGKKPKAQTLEITATAKSENIQQVFELSPGLQKVKLAFN